MGRLSDLREKMLKENDDLLKRMQALEIVQRNGDLNVFLFDRLAMYGARLEWNQFEFYFEVLKVLEGMQVPRSESCVTIDHDKWQDFIGRLEQWSQAYPLEMFGDIDARQLQEGYYSSGDLQSMVSRAAAGMARHVLSKILADLRELKDVGAD
jgi:hypothetical protein